METALAVSVVVVAYRSRAHLPACLASLQAAAEGLPLELVVVDNASGDGTPDLVRQAFPWARVLENETNRGFAAAANQGARGARGRHVLFLNPDAVPSAGSLAVLVRALDADPSVGLVGPQLLNPDRSPQPSAWIAPGFRSLAFDALLLANLFPRSRMSFLTVEGTEPREVSCLSGACLLARRECFESLAGFDERFFLYHEDFDLCLRARAAGYHVQLVPEARVVHSVGGSSFQDRRGFFLRFHESRGLLIRKHHPGLEGRLLAALHEGGVALRAAAYAVTGWLSGREDLRERAGHHAAALRRLLARRAS